MILDAGSKDFFKESLAFSTRSYLFRVSPDRYANPKSDRRGSPSIFLTRFLSDHSFAKDEDWQFLKPYLRALPRSHDYTRNILRMLHSGSVFTGPRLLAANMSNTDSCHACGERETHEHLFCQCKSFQDERPLRGSEPLISWVAGIFLEPPALVEFRMNSSSVLSLPDVPSKFRCLDHIFVDDSCFHQQWTALRAAASSVVIPGQQTIAVPLPGQDCTSQRAEIYAAVLAVHSTTGPIHVGTDCATVLSHIQLLKAHAYDKSVAKKFDNTDLWCLFCEVVAMHEGSVDFFKVKAHVTLRDHRQPQAWTDGNHAADQAAKKVARHVFLQKLSIFKPEIERAVCIQVPLVNLVRTMVARAQNAGLKPFEGVDPEGLAVPTLSRRTHCV